MTPIEQRLSAITNSLARLAALAVAKGTNTAARALEDALKSWQQTLANVAAKPTDSVAACVWWETEIRERVYEGVAARSLPPEAFKLVPGKSSIEQQYKELQVLAAVKAEAATDAKLAAQKGADGKWKRPVPTPAPLGSKPASSWLWVSVAVVVAALAATVKGGRKR